MSAKTQALSRPLLSPNRPMPENVRGTALACTDPRYQARSTPRWPDQLRRMRGPIRDASSLGRHGNSAANILNRRSDLVVQQQITMTTKLEEIRAQMAAARAIIARPRDGLALAAAKYDLEIAEKLEEDAIHAVVVAQEKWQMVTADLNWISLRHNKLVRALWDGSLLLGAFEHTYTSAGADELAAESVMLVGSPDPTVVVPPCPREILGLNEPLLVLDEDEDWEALEAKRQEMLRS